MQLAGKHVSMIGVGITAIAAIGGLLYYRSRSGSDTPAGAGGGGFPYFQTAALPGGSGGSATYVTATPSAATPAETGPNPSPTGLVQSLSLADTLSGLMSQFMGQKATLNQADADQGRSHAWDPLAYSGYINPTNTGGLVFGFGSVQTAAMGPGATVGNAISDIQKNYNSTGGGAQVPAVH